MTKRQAVLCLGLFGISLVLSNGRWAIPAAAWIAPAWLLRFLDDERAGRGLAFGFLIYLSAYFLMWRELVPAPGPLYFLIVGTYATVYFIPFVAHRFLAHRLGGPASTLVFPAAWVSCEFALNRLTPYGSWMSAAYTQPHDGPLMQLLAITGTTGISFVLAWFASVLAWAWGLRFDWRSCRNGILSFSSALAIVLTFGLARLVRTPAPVAVVRTATIVPLLSLQQELAHELARARQRGDVEAGDFAAITARADALNSDLFGRSEREARAGARIVAWSETAGRVLKQQESAFVDRSRAIARREGIYLFPAYGVWRPGGTPPFENKVIAIDPQGVVAWQFNKAHPVLGAETSRIAAGDGRLPILDTPFGRVSVAICHDLDFPQLLRQAGRQGVALLIDPSADWREVANLHADMASARAIENGFTLVRPAEGWSLAADSRGRWLGSTNSFTTSDPVLVAQVPLSGSTTFYPLWGDSFGWLAVSACFGLAVSARRRADG